MAGAATAGIATAGTVRSDAPLPAPPVRPAGSGDPDTHNRIRHDRIDNTGVVTLRVAGHGELPSAGADRASGGIPSRD